MAEITNWREFKAYLMDPEHYYAMPARGVTEERVKIGDVISVQFTVRCPEKDCWFIGHAPREDDVETVLNSHTCPMPPARNELPSGNSTLEKMWDELDDATAALLEAREWRTGTQTLRDTKLQGYCRGIAFTLSMMCRPHFRTADEISREAVARYRMRKGEAAFRQTPTYRYNPMPSATVRVAENPAVIGVKPVGKPVGALPDPMQRKPLAARIKKGVTRPPVDLSSISTEQASSIKKADTLGVMNRDDLARMYGITRVAVDAICGN